MILKIQKTGERQLAEMEDVILNDNISCPKVVYQVAQGICKTKDSDKWSQNNLRYDMTIIPPNFIGIEYVKTIGHYHEILLDSGLPAPEVIEIVYGNGMVILQKPLMISDKATNIFEKYNFAFIEELYLIKVNKGDKIIVPPGFAHVIINTKNQPLIIGNVQSLNVRHIYEPIKSQHGFAYYVIHKNARIEIVQNPHYKMLTGLKKIKSSDYNTPIKLKSRKSLYYIALNNPEKMDWLNHPESINWNLQ